MIRRKPLSWWTARRQIEQIRSLNDRRSSILLRKALHNDMFQDMFRYKKRYNRNKTFWSGNNRLKLRNICFHVMFAKTCLVLSSSFGIISEWKIYCVIVCIVIQGTDIINNVYQIICEDVKQPWDYKRAVCNVLWYSNPIAPGSWDFHPLNVVT